MLGVHHKSSDSRELAIVFGLWVYGASEMH